MLRDAIPVLVEPAHGWFVDTIFRIRGIYCLWYGHVVRHRIGNVMIALICKKRGKLGVVCSRCHAHWPEPKPGAWFRQDEPPLEIKS